MGMDNFNLLFGDDSQETSTTSTSAPESTSDSTNEGFTKKSQQKEVSKKDVSADKSSKTEEGTDNVDDTGGDENKIEVKDDSTNVEENKDTEVSNDITYDTLFSSLADAQEAVDKAAELDGIISSLQSGDVSSVLDNLEDTQKIQVVNGIFQYSTTDPELRYQLVYNTATDIVVTLGNYIEGFKEKDPENYEKITSAINVIENIFGITPEDKNKFVNMLNNKTNVKKEDKTVGKDTDKNKPEDTKNLPKDLEAKFIDTILQHTDQGINTLIKDLKFSEKPSINKAISEQFKSSILEQISQDQPVQTKLKALLQTARRTKYSIESVNALTGYYMQVFKAKMKVLLPEYITTPTTKKVGSGSGSGSDSGNTKEVKKSNEDKKPSKFEQANSFLEKFDALFEDD